MSINPITIDLDLTSENRGLILLFWTIFFAIIFGSMAVFIVIYLDSFGKNYGINLVIMAFQVMLTPILYPNMRSVPDIDPINML